MKLTRIISPVLEKELKEIAGMNDEEVELYMSLLTKKCLRKKDYLLMPGDICRYVSYIIKGCMRRYIIDEHSKEIILNFAMEDHWVGDLESFVFQKPTDFYMQTLEDCELTQLSRENFSRACNEIPKFKIFHDDKAQRNHFSALKRLSKAKSATPEEKYLDLMEKQPQIFQRVPLHYIASYLGIEPESLSRIRKRIIIHPHIS
ncbi:MAG: Crp/Fnr family transcriptional regulator [Ignavibacteriaceae bacterium]